MANPNASDPLVHLARDPAAEAVRILGVDAWARRTGRSYGTILVDLERHCPIALVDGRTAADLAAWLRAHPGIEVLSRDRAQEYVQGGRHGAPDAMQVADRWHLLKNLGAVLERALAHNHRLLRTERPGSGGGSTKIALKERSDRSADHAAKAPQAPDVRPRQA